MRRLAAALALLACGGASQAAKSGLWVFVDGHGAAHFSSQPLDSRYQLLLGDAGANRRASARVPGKSDGTQGLITWLDIAPEVMSVMPWLREAARLHGVDAELLKAVIAVESGFNALAVSPRGALGLMQITPATGERYATAAERSRPVEQRLLDARINIHTGARMLADLTRRYSRIDVVLAAWNAGEGSVQRHGGGMPPFEETQAHVHLVMELYWALLQRSQGPLASELGRR
ncbi:MAG: lytic transglycosylase domain-containing protein [Rubrivivax sp.]|nr:lytic transglycosylase domain-containing protein [Rubrivivax sp.]